MPNVEPYDVDDFLAHYGVKGMRWGHRKQESDSDRLATIDKRLPKLDREKNYLRRSISADATIAGSGNRANAAKSVLKLKVSKAKDGSTRLDPSDRTQVILDKYGKKAINSKITRRAVGRTLGVGMVATGVLLGGAAVAYKKIPDKRVASGLALIAALQARQTMTVSLGTLAVGLDAARDLEASELRKERRAIAKRINH